MSNRTRTDTSTTKRADGASTGMHETLATIKRAAEAN